MSKQYIGDSVYADFDGYGIVLTTENGNGPTNTIYLEPAVWVDLAEYVARLKDVPASEEAFGTEDGEG